MKKYKKLEQVVEELKGAVKAHGKQAEIVEDHIKDMHKGKKYRMGGRIPVMGSGTWAGKRVPGMYKTGGSTAAWQRKEGKNKSGGLNEAGRKSYEKENPGSDLKAPQPEGGPRKKSFCARMRGMRKRQKPSNNTGEDRLSLSLKKWNC